MSWQQHYDDWKTDAPDEGTEPIPDEDELPDIDDYQPSEEELETYFKRLREES